MLPFTVFRQLFFFICIFCVITMFFCLSNLAQEIGLTGKIDLLAHALSSTAVLCDIVKLHYVA